MSTATKGIVAVVVVVALAIAVWLIRPLFVDTLTDEPFPLSVDAEVPDDMTQDEVEAEMAAAAEAPPVEEDEPMPGAAPTTVLTGQFEGADGRHSGSGTATVYELEDGSHVLRFEDFEVTNGPDLRVYLAPVGPDGPDVGAGTELGRLKGNIGNQNYDIPADLDLAQPLAVVIYCQPFSVTFATAPLA